MSSLANRIIFITGATSGFGYDMAKLFLKEGARVIATGRRAERLHALAQECASDRLFTAALDVRSNAAVETIVSNLPAPFKSVDTLINNAGLALGLEPLQTLPLEKLEEMVDTNIKGTIYCTKALLPGMIERDSGHIVNLGSIAGTYPYPGGNVYGATKAFMKQFSLNLRCDVLSKNIRVTNIEPGMADTEFSLTRFEGDKARADAVYKNMQPLTGEDIAATVLWCLTQPRHVNINRVEIMPVMQAFSPFAVHRQA